MKVIFLFAFIYSVVSQMDSPIGQRIVPGTYVKRNDPTNEEVGIVVSCWFEEEIQAKDCYIAFFGENFPVGKPPTKPYIFRYAATSLTVVDNPYYDNK